MSKKETKIVLQRRVAELERMNETLRSTNESLCSMNESQKCAHETEIDKLHESLHEVMRSNKTWKEVVEECKRERREACGYERGLLDALTILAGKDVRDHNLRLRPAEVRP